VDRSNLAAAVDKGDPTVNFSPPAEIFGVDGIIVLVVVVLVVFGSTRIPKMARSLGSAQKEFKKGLDEGATEDGTDPKAVAVITPPVVQVVQAPASAPAQPAPAQPAADGTVAPS
jgi:sec-independent protein translocase protein TatA